MSLNLTDKVQIDNIFAHSTGATVLVYSFPNIDMSGYDRADFLVNAFGLSAGTATGAGAGCIFRAAVYTSTAATSTSLTALSSATASFGATATTTLGITGAQSLVWTFNTAGVGTTCSMNGIQMKCTAAQGNASYEFLGNTGVSNATYSSAFCALVNSSLATFSSYLIASTEAPAGATHLSSNAAYVRLRNPGSRTLSATGHYGATADKGILVKGDYSAVIGVPAEKMKGARYISIGIVSSALAVPFSVNLIRSAARNTPGNAGLAAKVNLGTTTT